MALLRFKEHFVVDIKNPSEGYKTKTTRATERKKGEYEVVYGIMPNPLFYTIRTGIMVEIYDVQHKYIAEYTKTELKCDVNHTDVHTFIRQLNHINKTNKFHTLTKTWLHSFHVTGIEETNSKVSINEATKQKALQAIEYKKKGLVKKWVERGKKQFGC